MTEIRVNPVVINRLVRWAEKQDMIRAMLLFSSRANPTAEVDLFSDYDILLAVTDVHAFHADDRWLEDFGAVLVVFRNPIGTDDGFENFGFITHYAEGIKIDYCFYPVDYLIWAAKEAKLPDDLDNGYQVLLDKDGLTDKLQSPTYSAYLPCRPTQAEYLAQIEEFFNDAIYVAKHLWRDNLFIMKSILDDGLKFRSLRRMLEWHMETQNNWQVKPGAYGKGLKKYIDPEIWSMLERTYVGAGSAENWDALFSTINLYRKLAVEVAQQLGFQYPQAMDQGVVTYIQKIQSLDKPAAQ